MRYKCWRLRRTCWSKLVALGGISEPSPAHAMEVVAQNIEHGNQQVCSSSRKAKVVRDCIVNGDLEAVTQDDDITLKGRREAFRLSVYTLRTEADRGRLAIYKIGNATTRPR